MIVGSAIGTDVATHGNHRPGFFSTFTSINRSKSTSPRRGGLASYASIFKAFTRIYLEVVRNEYTSLRGHCADIRIRFSVPSIYFTLTMSSILMLPGGSYTNFTAIWLVCRMGPRRVSHVSPHQHQLVGVYLRCQRTRQSKGRLERLSNDRHCTDGAYVQTNSSLPTSNSQVCNASSDFPMCGYINAAYDQHG